MALRGVRCGLQTSREERAAVGVGNFLIANHATFPITSGQPDLVEHLLFTAYVLVRDELVHNGPPHEFSKDATSEDKRTYIHDMLVSDLAISAGLTPTQKIVEISIAWPTWPSA
jgi:hypothetical protein